MKKFLSCTKTLIVLLVVALISLGFYAYMLTRPISYGMSYHIEMEYEGETFEGAMRFYPDGTMVNSNTSLNEEIASRYYYKDGYIFFTEAQTEEEYAKEVAYINENFATSVRSPFYAAQINAFEQVLTGPDGYTSVYSCTSAVIFAIAYAVFELLLIVLTCTSFVLREKSKNCK